MTTASILALPPGIVRIFEFMTIAEEEIAEAKMADSSGAFAALVPPAGFSGLSPRIYRHHAREIVARYVRPAHAGIDPPALRGHRQRCPLPS